MADQVIAGDVGMAGVETYPDGSDGVEALDQLGYLFEAATQRELGACCIFDENLKSAVAQGDAVDGFGDGCGGEIQPSFAGQASP